MISSKAHRDAGRPNEAAEPARLLKLALIVGFAVLLIWTTLLLAPFTPAPLEFGIDPGHIFASNYLIHTDARYGPDIVFPFGPLGYIVNPQHTGNNLAIAMAVRGIVWVLLMVELVLLFRSSAKGRVQAFVIVAGLLVARFLLLIAFDYYLLALALLVSLRPGRGLSIRRWLPIAAIAGALMLMKFSAFAMAVVIAGFVFARSVEWNDWKPQVDRRAIALAAIGGVAGPVAYLFHNPSIGGLFDFLRGALQLSSGYSAAMSVPTSARDWTDLLLCGGTLAVVVAAGVFTRVLDVVTAIETCALFFLTMKHGFVRADGHVTVFYGFYPMIAAYVIARMNVPAKKMWAPAAALVLMLGLSLTGASRWFPVGTLHAWSAREGLGQLSRVMRWNEMEQRLDAQRNKAIEDNKLSPAVAQQVRGTRTMILPWDLSYAASGLFTFEPFYTLQAYSAYTRYLDARSAHRITERAAMLDNIIYDWKAIDFRHPLLEMPASWDAIFRRYVPKVVEPGRLVAVRRPQPLSSQLEPVGEVDVQPGEWVEVRRENTALSASLALEQTLLGSLRNTLYKTEPVLLTVWTDSGAQQDFRIVPDVLAHPFPLNWLPVSEQSLVEAWQNGRVNDPVVRIRLSGPGIQSYRAPVKMQLYRDRGVPLTVAVKTYPALREIVPVDSAGAIPQTAAGSVDLIDGGPVTAGSRREDAKPVRVSQGVRITGWLGTSSKPAEPFEAVYAVVNGMVVEATRRERPDVASFFKNPAMQNSGFEAHIPGGMLKPGVQAVDLVGIKRQPAGAYRMPSPIYINAQ